MEQEDHAFPTNFFKGWSGGLTLRDWFASQVDVGYFLQFGGNNDPEKVAEYRYKFADAMMKEREKYER